jgi:hypothetical protein
MDCLRFSSRTFFKYSPSDNLSLGMTLINGLEVSKFAAACSEITTPSPADIASIQTRAWHSPSLSNIKLAQSVRVSYICSLVNEPK